MATEYGELKQAYSEMLFCWQDIAVGDWRREEMGKSAEILFLFEKWGEKDAGVWKSDDRFRYKLQQSKKHGELKQEVRSTNEEKKKTDRFYGSRSFIAADAFGMDGEPQACLGAAAEDAVLGSV